MEDMAEVEAAKGESARFALFNLPLTLSSTTLEYELSNILSDTDSSEEKEEEDLDSMATEPSEVLQEDFERFFFLYVPLICMLMSKCIMREFIGNMRAKTMHKYDCTFS